MTGKTRCIFDSFVEHVKEYPEEKFLVLVHRRNLSLGHLKQLETLGFVNYLEEDGKVKKEIEGNRVIVTIHSLWKLKTTDYPIIFMDEITSILDAMNSKIGFKNKRKSLNNLENMLRGCHTALCADAFPSRAVYTLLEGCAMGHELLVVKNSFKTDDRIYDLTNNWSDFCKEFKRYTTEDERREKPVALTSGSKRKAKFCARSILYKKMGT